jgi:hypothetical protein
VDKLDPDSDLRRFADDKPNSIHYVWNMSLFQHFFKVLRLIGRKDPDPDPERTNGNVRIQIRLLFSLQVYYNRASNCVLRTADGVQPPLSNKSALHTCDVHNFVFWTRCPLVAYREGGGQDLVGSSVGVSVFSHRLERRHLNKDIPKLSVLARRKKHYWEKGTFLNRW